MAEHTRGQDRKSNEDSGHNKAQQNAARRPLPGSGFEGMNFEQIRMPYKGAEHSRSVNGEVENAGGTNCPG